LETLRIWIASEVKTLAVQSSLKSRMSRDDHGRIVWLSAAFWFIWARLFNQFDKRKSDEDQVNQRLSEFVESEAG
jgi:hypothetical protein